MRNLLWTGKELTVLDQTKLPSSVEYIHCTDWRSVAEAIKKLRIRGAPAIGVAAGYALVLAAHEASLSGKTKTEQVEQWLRYADMIKVTRPTAVNLGWAVSRIVDKVQSLPKDMFFAEIVESITKEAIAIEEEDKALNAAIGEKGAQELVNELAIQFDLSHSIMVHEKGDTQGITFKKLRILTHCNTGSLATAGIGTALGVIRKIHDLHLIEMVYADETRPLLQGSRLTALELLEDNIPVTLITDSMAAYVMQQGLVDAVIVGADRISSDGDVANKIGTYSLAILANAHHIPFYVAAPSSSFDFNCKSGADIPIEMRDEAEVRQLHGVETAPSGIPVLNPAFDVTPAELVSAIITEKGVLKAPLSQSIVNLKSDLGL